MKENSDFCMKKYKKMSNKEVEEFFHSTYLTEEELRKLLVAMFMDMRKNDQVTDAKMAELHRRILYSISNSAMKIMVPAFILGIIAAYTAFTIFLG